MTDTGGLKHGTQWNNPTENATMKKTLLKFKDHMVHARKRRTFVLVLLFCVLCFAAVLARGPTMQIFVLDRQDQHQCECPYTDGETELEQMQRYWSMRMGVFGQDISMRDLAVMVNSSGLYDDIHNQTASIDGYTYEVGNAMKYLRSDGFTIAKFFITEQYHNQLTEGGATFKVIVRGPHTRNACAYRDFFDGSYTVCCILREEQNTVEFYLMNVNFTSYQLYYSLHHMIHEVKVTSFDSTQNSLDRKDNGKQWCHEDAGYWVNQNVNQIDTWKLKTNNKLSHFYNKEELDQCFTQQYHDTVFTGDSHLRAMFGYIQVIRDMRRDTIITKEKTLNYPITYALDMTFYTSTLIDTLIGHLELIIEDTKNLTKHETIDPDKPRLLVVDSGCHDLAFNNSAQYIPKFDRVIELLTEIKEMGVFRMFFQNIPPWPHEMEHNNDRHLNMFVNAAVAHYASLKLNKLEIPIIDLRSLALPFEDMSVCGLHFICADKFPQEHKGVAGREATQRLLKQVCS